MADVAELAIEVAIQGKNKVVSDFKEIKDAGQLLEEQTLSLTEALKGLASAWAFKELAEGIKNLALVGARYETLGATLGVMANNAGLYKVEMDQLQKKMEQTGITAMESRRGLQIMAAAQVDLSKASDLARVAQDAATIAGINSSEAFNNLVRGIATGESRIVRHMGIMVNYKSAIHDWAAAHGKAVQSLTATEIAQARLESTLKEGIKRAGVYEEAMTTAGKQILSMQRYTDNLKLTIGETFNSATNELIFAVVDAMKQAKDWMDAWAASGEKAVVMEKLRGYMESFINATKSGVKFLWDHAEAIKLIALAYGSLKFATYAEAFVKSATAMYGASLQGQAMMINEARNRVVLTESILAENEARQLELALERAKHMNWFRTNAVLAEEAALVNANTVAYNQLVAARERLAVAEGGGAKAISMFSGAVTALGGPVVVLIGLLTMAAAAWYMFANKEKRAQEENDAALAKEVENIERDIKRKQEVLTLLNEGRKEEADTMDHNFRPIIQLQERQLEVLKARRISTEELADAQKRLADAKIDLSINQGYREFAGDVKLVREQLALAAEIERIQNNVTSAKEKELELQKADNALQEKRKAMADAARGGGADSEGTPRDAWFINFRIEVQKRLSEEMLKGLGLSKEQTAIDKANILYKEQLAKIDAHIIELLKNKKTYSEAEANQARDTAKRLRDETVAAAERRAELDEWSKANKEATKRTNDLTDNIQKLRDKNWEYGKTAREIAEYRLLDTDATKQEIAAHLDLVDALEAELQAAADIEERKKLHSEGTALNKRKMEEQEQLSHLDKVAAEVKLLPGVYERAWTEIMMKGESATAFIVQTAHSAFGQMENAFVQFATTGKFQFKSLVASIMADTARLAAQKSFQQLFQLAIGAYLGGGDTTTTTANTSYQPDTIGEIYNIGGGEDFSFTPGTVPSGSLFIPAKAGGTAASSSSSIINQISVVVKDGGTETKSSSNSAGKGMDIARDLENMMDAWAVKNSQPGGHFNPIGG